MYNNVYRKLFSGSKFFSPRKPEYIYMELKEDKNTFAKDCDNWIHFVNFDYITNHLKTCKKLGLYMQSYLFLEGAIYKYFF